MSNSDNSIELEPKAACEGLPQSPSNLNPPAESQDELNVAPASSAAQTATPSVRTVRGRPRADTATLENWRDEKDPVQRRRLRQNLYNRQRDNRARQARIDAKNGDSTDEALEMEQAEDTMDQKNESLMWTLQRAGGTSCQLRRSRDGGCYTRSAVTGTRRGRTRCGTPCEFALYCFSASFFYFFCILDRS